MPRPRIVEVVLFLIAFLACGVYVLAANGDNVVAAVGRGIPNWFVLAHEEHGDRGGDAAEGPLVSADVDVVPCSRVGKASLTDCVNDEVRVEMWIWGGDVPCLQFAT